MDTGLFGHGDAFNVFPVDAKVGAADGDGDAAQQGAETWNDLKAVTQLAHLHAQLSPRLQLRQAV